MPASVPVIASQLPEALGAAGGLLVEGVAGGEPVPVSGSITVAGIVSLDPTTLAALENTTVTVAGPVSITGPVSVTGTFWPATQPVSGTIALDAASLAALETVSISGSVAVTGPLTDAQLRASAVPVSPPTSNSAVVTSTAGSTSSVTLLPVNAFRKYAAVYNDSSAALYLKLGTAASATSFTVKLLQDDFYELPASYAGTVEGLWASATGNARVTEVS